MTAAGPTRPRRREPAIDRGRLLALVCKAT